MNPITSITKGPRQSNMELLRIVAMFMVLVLHADFLSIGDPDKNAFLTNPLDAWTRTVIESMTIVCVNVFVLISGWFGIKPTFKGLGNFVFQCAYFLFGTYAFLVLTRQDPFTFKGLAACFCLTSDFWFIKAYLALYILSPILNAFINTCTKRQLELVLIAFYAFQTIWGWSNAVHWVSGGYSTFSFIGLYLLARYLKLFGLQIVKWGGVDLYPLCGRNFSAMVATGTLSSLHGGLRLLQSTCSPGISRTDNVVQPFRLRA